MAKNSRTSHCYPFSTVEPNLSRTSSILYVTEDDLLVKHLLVQSFGKGTQ